MAGAPSSQHIFKMAQCEARPLNTGHRPRASVRHRTLFWGKLGLADHDLSSLMDGVYNSDQIETIMDFNYRILEVISGPTA
jgi:hypothetical protein